MLYFNLCFILGICPDIKLYQYSTKNTHTHTYIYIYIRACECVSIRTLYVFYYVKLSGNVLCSRYGWTISSSWWVHGPFETLTHYNIKTRIGMFYHASLTGLISSLPVPTCQYITKYLLGNLNNNISSYFIIH